MTSILLQRLVYGDYYYSLNVLTRLPLRDSATRSLAVAHPAAAARGVGRQTPVQYHS